MPALAVRAVNRVRPARGRNVVDKAINGARLKVDRQRCTADSGAACASVDPACGAIGAGRGVNQGATMATVSMVDVTAADVSAGDATAGDATAGDATKGQVMRAGALATGYTLLASTAANGASHCCRIIDCVTLDPFQGHAMAAALEYRVGCIGDLAVSLERRGGLIPHATGGVVVGGSRQASTAVTVAVLELNASIAQATGVLEEGMRLRQAQREIVADIQSNLLRTERKLRDLTAETNDLAQRVAAVIAAR